MKIPYCHEGTRVRACRTPMIFLRCFVTVAKSLRNYFTYEWVKTTAWLFHVGTKTDCGLTVRVSCLKNKPDMRTVVNGDTREVIIQYLSHGFIRIQVLPSTTNIKHTLSCTQSSKITVKGIRLSQFGVSGCHAKSISVTAWLKTWEDHWFFYIINTTRFDNNLV